MKNTVIVLPLPFKKKKEEDSKLILSPVSVSETELNYSFLSYQAQEAKVEVTLF